MYYRRKIILAVVESFNNRLGNTDFQKLLFLFTRMQENPCYEFVPYKYGCFSFQSSADKSAMIKTGLLEDNEQWIKKSSHSYFHKLNNTDKKQMLHLKKNYLHLRVKDLILYVYSHYPYYAIDSEIAPFSNCSFNINESH